MRIALSAVVAVAVAVAGLAGCSSSGAPSKATPSCNVACARSELSFTPSAEASSDPNGLTGFGATRAAWDAHHQANPDPSLDEGCCYGPPIADPDNGGTTDTWNLAAVSGDLVNTLTHNFAPHTSRDEALAAIQSEDMPADAKQVSSKMGDGCELLLFHSARLAAADPAIGQAISIGLYSGATATVYDASDVRQAILDGVDELDDC